MNYEEEILSLKQRVQELEKLCFGKLTTQPIAVESIQTANNRDKTKYMFEGIVYPKNRLVLAIVKKYVEQNNPTFEELSKVFDKSLQGSLGVVEIYENALKISDAAKRYFLKDDDILSLSDNEVVVCTQWGIFNIVKFVKRAQSLNYDIQTI